MNLKDNDNLLQQILHDDTLTDEALNIIKMKINIQKAKEMLVTTDLPVSQIAQFVGYKSYTTFYKQFIAVEECTPKKYRNIKAHTNENKDVVKNANGIYQLVSEMDSVDFKEKFDIKL